MDNLIFCSRCFLFVKKLFARNWLIFASLLDLICFASHQSSVSELFLQSLHNYLIVVQRIQLTMCCLCFFAQSNNQKNCYSNYWRRMSNYTQQAICFNNIKWLGAVQKAIFYFSKCEKQLVNRCDPLRTNWALGFSLFRNKRRLQARNNSRRFFLLISIVPKWHLTDESSNFSRVDFHRFRTVNCAVLVTLLRQIQFVSNFLF